MIITVLLWVIGLCIMLISLKKDKKKTLTAIKMAKGMMKGMIGNIISILLIIGLIQTLIPPESIKTFLGESNVWLGSLVAGIAGSITIIPGFVAFPLVGSLVDVGASIIPATAFLTTLTMVGVATYPLERQEFGAKFTIVRNVFSFGFAIIIALLMGVIL